MCVVSQYTEHNKIDAVRCLAGGDGVEAEKVEQSDIVRCHVLQRNYRSTR